MAKQKVITEAKVTDLIQDDKNFNKGNEFGESLIEKSFNKFGAGRSVLIDKNNRLIAGNKSTEKFVANGGEKVIIIDTDGDTLVAVRRKDVDLDTPQGREIALADNAAAKANIVLDAEVIEAEVGEVVAEEWGINSKDDPKKPTTLNLSGFKKTHILISFPPDKMIEVQEHLEKILQIDSVEYEQSSN